MAFSGSGSGTVIAPYQITTVEQLNEMRDDLSSYFILMNDLDFDLDSSYSDPTTNKSGYITGSGWLPVGDVTVKFAGGFNGDGKTISNLFIDRSGTDSIGLFGFTDAGSLVKNVFLSDVDITGANYTASIEGYCRGTILNCKSDGNIVGAERVGGIVGFLNADHAYQGTVIGSGSSCNVSGTKWVGGFCGYNYSDGTVGFSALAGLILNCYSKGSVTRISGVEINFGGFVGFNDRATFINNFSTGKVEWETGPHPTDKGFAGSERTGGAYRDEGNFFDTDISLQATTTGNAKGRTTVQLKNILCYTDYDYPTASAGLVTPWAIFDKGDVTYTPNETNVLGLSGSNDVNVGSVDYATNKITLSVKFKLTDFMSVNVCLMGWGDWNEDLTIYIRSDECQFSIVSGTAARYEVSYPTGMLNLGWHNIIVTMDTTTAETKVYLDNVYLGTITCLSGSGNLPMVGDLHFGAFDDGAGYFPGNLSEILIYDDIISAAERLNILENEEVTNNLVGRWKLNEGSGTTLTDDIGANNGTIVGPSWLYEDVNTSIWSIDDTVDYPESYREETSSSETISVEESVYLGEESDVNIPKLILAINESLYLGEESSVVFDKLSIDINESLYLGENIDVNIPKLILAINESLYLGENIDVNLSKLILNINESVYLGESSDAHLNEQVEYGVRIISYNPLIILSGINTVKLTHIDISTPAVPVVTTHVVSGITNAKDVVLNDSNDYFYLAGADGIVVKIEKADLDAQTIVDTSDTDDFQKISSLETFFRTFASTDDSSGEIIMIDEATISKINTDVRWSKRITNTISCLVNTILGKKINCDVRFSENVESVLKTDIRWLKYEYADLTQHPVDFNDIQVKINGTDLAPLNDVDLKSINITHTKGEYSTASFSLNRRHDNPNYDNQGNSSQITNQNAVLIYIDGHLEFSGTIQSFNAESELESIVVNARMTEPSRNKQTRSIPLASVGESLNLYHCLLNSVYVENPDLNTQAVITNENGLYWSGNEWVGDLNEAQVFASHALAESSIPSDYTSQQAWPTNYEESPAYYKGIQVNLGTSITQNIERYSSFTDSAALATKIEEGTFNPKQNWSYFWFASFENFISNVITTSSRYLGTSLGSLSADTWKINGASYKRQKQLDDDTADLGNYYVGSAPFQIISLQNGKLTTKDKWVDKSDGLYREKDASYDYIQYAKDAAALEYSKLKTINNSIIPVTSSQIDLTIDGYYYYAIKLLTRLNLSNTTASGIYFGSNGFPVSVKSISIDTNSMRVSIECDNQLSVEEIGEIDRNYPDVNSDEYINDKESVLNYRKYDPNVSGYIT